LPPEQLFAARYWGNGPLPIKTQEACRSNRRVRSEVLISF